MNAPSPLILPHRLVALPLSALLLCLFAIGCNSEPTVPDAPPEIELEVEGDHDHPDDDHTGHDHAAPGPHGGHILVLDPGHHHVELVHVEEDNVVEVYLGELAELAERVQLVAEIEGKDPVTYDLEPATEALGTGGYQIESPNLLTHIEMTDGTTSRVTLVVETGEATLKAPLAGDHDHEHDH